MILPGAKNCSSQLSVRWTITLHVAAMPLVLLKACTRPDNAALRCCARRTTLGDVARRMQVLI